MTADGVGTAEDWLVELETRLRGLVGVEGYRALLARAVELAAAGRGQARPAAVDAAVTATLAELVRLLEQFLGHDMTRRIIGDIGPWLSDSHVSPAEPMCMAG